jgi:hypothetical protein
MSAIEKPWASMSPSGQPSAAQPGEQFERAAAVGLGAVATAAGLGHGVAAAVLGRCLKDIRRSETIRGRAGKPSTAPSESCRRARPGIAMAAITKRASAASSARASIGPVFYTFGKSPLLPKSRDVTYRQCKCLSVLACGTFGVDLNRSESRGGAPMIPLSAVRARVRDITYSPVICRHHSMGGKTCFEGKNSGALRSRQGQAKKDVQAWCRSLP